MNDQEKRALLRKIFTDPKGAVAPGITDALFARLAQDCGYKVLHLSGNAMHRNFCLPDRNLLTVTQIAQRAAQISEATEIPLIVDAGSACVETIALACAVKYYERAGTAALRFEDALVNEYGASPDELSIAPVALMTDRIKAAADARRDSALVLIARCDARPKETLSQVQDRLAAYAEAGADALGVHLSDLEDFRRVGAGAPAPLVSMWPRNLMDANDFIDMGFRVALLPSSVPIAAVAAAREMLMELKHCGRDRDYFARQSQFTAAEQWYKRLGST